MLGLFRRIFGKKDDALTDASRIYKKLMHQARRADFYGPGRVPDSYDGRIDFLTLHVAVILHQLNTYGDNGQHLSQAIYDVMRDDFEVAMREEGLSDTGIKRRIKPMMALFFTRVKTYVDALNENKKFEKIFEGSLLKDADSSFATQLTQYTVMFSSELSTKSLGDIALAEFTFPKLS